MLLVDRSYIYSKAISLLRFPLILGVVSMHFSGGVNNSIFFEKFISFGLNYFSVSVPLYFAIFGYLFWKEDESYTLESYKNKLSKRIYTLVIPYLIWNILFLLLSCLINFRSIGLIDLYKLISCNSNSFQDFVTSLLLGKGMPINYPLWFLRDLIVCSLLSPIFYRLLKSFPLVTICTLMFGWILTDISSGRTYFTAFFWFSIGEYVKMYKTNLLWLVDNCVIICFLSICLALFRTFVYYDWMLEYKFYHFSLLVHVLATLSVALKLTIRNYKIPHILNDATFWIFSSHAFVQVAWVKFILPHSKSIPDFFLFILGIIVVLLICITSFMVLKKYMPKLISILVGNRM